MVSDMIVSRYSSTLPASTTERKIPGGPLYSAEEVVEVLESGSDVVRTWTQKCTADVQNLALDAEDLAALVIKAVRHGHFKGSEWCQQKPSGPWAACDAYALTCREWFEAARKEFTLDYYFKFAIGKTGAILLLVSCHLSS